MLLLFIKRLSLCGCAFIAGLLVGGCKDDEPGLKCAADHAPAQLCCLDPEGDAEESCEDVCAKKCEGDADCSGEDGDSCRGGVCGFEDDCSLQ
ncbi:hypothetical protein [Nannocystis radixulma]|uniref:Lipoprotein n=1 Tax=Nannocystis radixulma TaxID=2995305 RepID=A0ABT5B6U9_9BACT|nr:hypothetical protein [Nannocystis radixulma]MDC0669834.1 hypothetical protein [Nannocystis radixulma]